MADPRLQRRPAQIFNSQAIIYKAAEHNEYVVQHPARINEWSDALKDLVTQGTFLGDDETRSALACECMVRDEGQILGRLLVDATTLTIKGVVESASLDTLLEAIPDEGGPASLALSGVVLDQEGCNSLLQVLVKSGATSLSLDACVPMDLRWVCHSELTLTSLKVAHRQDDNVSAIVSALVALSPSLEKVTILVGERWSAEDLYDVADALDTHRQARNLEVLLPSSGKDCITMLACLGPAIRQPSLNSLAIACRAPGNPDSRLCHDLGETLTKHPNLREISLRGWTMNSQEAHDAFDQLLGQLHRMENLVKLDLSDNLGIGTRLVTFNCIEHMRTLKFLDLKGTADMLHHHEFLSRLLFHNRQLTHLALPDLGEDFDLPALAKVVQGHPSLRHLDVRCINSGRPENEKAFLEIMTICSRRNQPAYQELLSQRLVEAISRYMPADSTPIKPSVPLPRDLAEDVSARGLEARSSARLTQVNKHMQEIALEAQAEWERRQHESRKQPDEG